MAVAARRPPSQEPRVGSAAVLILLRHGRTASNASRRLLGRMDVPLDELGRRQAKALGQSDCVQQATRVVSSPLRRALDTAAALGRPVTVDERWTEIDYGVYRRPAAGPGTGPFPAMGAGYRVRSRWGRVPARRSGDRVRAACEDLWAEAVDDDVVVVSHVSPIKAAVAWALGVGDETTWRMFVDVASVTCIGPGRPGAGLPTPSLRLFNDTHQRPSSVSRRRIVALMVDTVTGIPQRRHLVTEIPGPKSRALAARRAAAVAPGVSSVLPVYVERAEGRSSSMSMATPSIDLGSGIAVTSIGHAVPRWWRRRGSRSGASPTPASWSARTKDTWRVCERLNGLTPGDFAKTSALFNSGAEAVENAVKIARHATRRQAVIVFDHAYHGRTNLTMALTAKNMPYKDGFGPFAPEVYRVPMSYPFRDPAGILGSRRRRRGPST